MTTSANIRTEVAPILLSLKENGKLSVSKTNELTTSIATRGRKLDADIHAVALASLQFAMPHEASEVGNYNAEPARALLAAMSRSSRAKTLVDWFTAFSNIRLTQGKDKSWSVKLVSSKSKDFRDADTLLSLYAQAENKPFWEVEEQTKGPQAFFVSDALKKLLDTAFKNLENMSEEDIDLVTELQAIQKKANVIKAKKELELAEAAAA